MRAQQCQHCAGTGFEDCIGDLDSEKICWVCGGTGTEDEFSYVRSRYKVNPRRGMRIVMDGRPGRITSGAGHYLRVRFDGEKISSYVHPTWEMVYEG